MLGEDLLIPHAVCEHRHYGRDREAQPPDTGQAAYDSGAVVMRS